MRLKLSVPVAPRFEAQVCGHSLSGIAGSTPADLSGRVVYGVVCGRLLAGIAGLNPADGMDTCVVCCRGISDRRTEGRKVHNG